MSPFAGLPRTFVALWWGSVVNRMGLLVVPMLTFYLRKEHGFTLAQAGDVVALFGLGQACSSMLGGALADHLGRRATVLLALVGGAVLMTAFGFVEDPLWFPPMAFVVALVTELYRPAVFAIVADTVAPDEQQRAYGLLYVAVNLGFAIAPALGGWLARVDFHLLFLGNALANLAYAGIVRAWVPETKGPPTPHGHPRTGLVDVLRDAPFLWLTACVGLVALIAHQGAVSLAGHMSALGHDEAAYGSTIALNGLLIVLFQTWLGRRLAPLPPAPVLAVGALLTGLGFWLHGTGTALFVHVAAVVIWTLGEMFQSPTASALIARLAPADARGRYQGVFALSWTLAAFLAPTIGPRVLERFGATGLWGGCLALGVIAALGALALGPALGRRMAGEG